jgi:serine/threonine-protein kinase
VVGVPYDQAAAQLQGAGFAVARRDVESNDPKDTVVQEDPLGNTLAPKGSTVTLYVSKGPKDLVVPEVGSFSRADAISTLRNSGFKVVVESSDVQDPNLDGVVLFQAPDAGTSAPPGSTVTITVGHYVPPAQTTTEPPATTTTPTDTTATDTTFTDTTAVP